MNTHWGVYNLQGRLADGTTVDARTRHAARWFVRWRVDGAAHKRTFKQKGHAVTFREQLQRAQVMGWPADQRGWPLPPGDTATISAPEPSPPTVPAAAGPTFEEYCLASWYPNMAPLLGPKNRIGHRNNMRFAVRALRYAENDYRLTRGDVSPGASILLEHITHDDVLASIRLRRATNARTAAVNRRRTTEAFERGAHDLTLAPERASPATVRAFYVTLSMILRSAERSHLTNGDPLAGTAVSAPKPQRGRISRRIVPSVDEVFDLADAIARLGPIATDGRPTGERFRSLVLCAGTLAPRPGELTAHRPDWIDWTDPVIVRFHNSEAPIYDTEEGIAGFQVHPLKHRTDGDWREVPALADVADALRTHIERGYATDDHTWTGPRGATLNWGNLRDTYWRPACEAVFAGSPKSALAGMSPQVLRKAAITYWLDSGISPYLASEWAGHSEDVSRRYYAGMSSTTYAREAALLAKHFSPPIQ